MQMKEPIIPIYWALSANGKSDNNYLALKLWLRRWKEHEISLAHCFSANDVFMLNEYLGLDSPWTCL